MTQHPIDAMLQFDANANAQANVDARVNGPLDVLNGLVVMPLNLKVEIYINFHIVCFVIFFNLKNCVKYAKFTLYFLFIFNMFNMCHNETCLLTKQRSRTERSIEFNT